MIGQIIFGLLIVGGIGGYYYRKFGGKGGAAAYLTKILGLREGEKVTQTWTCFYDIERTFGEKVGEVLGTHTRGISLIVGLTDQGRLVLGEIEKNESGGNNPPMGFEPGKLVASLSDKKPERAQLVGTSGMEPAVVILMEPKDRQPSFRLQIAKSGFESIKRLMGGT